MKSRRRIPGIWMVSGAVVSFLIFALIVAKSQWHWMQLLIIPVILAIGAFVYNLAQVRMEKRLAAQGYQNDQERAAHTQREDLLQTYLNRITELLLDKDLRSSQSDTEVRTRAHAQTLTTLPKLDAQRKGGLIQFLSESQLVEIISLSGANLNGANLNGANLGGANLSGANLGDADLSRADLSRANLRHANLGGAYLSAAKLLAANLSNAYLKGTKLIDADLSRADLYCANLSDANLSYSNLTDTDLHFANLSSTNLSGANLSGANLSGANLSGAYLNGTIVTQEQLDSARIKPFKDTSISKYSG